MIRLYNIQNGRIKEAEVDGQQIESYLGNVDWLDIQ